MISAGESSTVSDGGPECSSVAVKPSFTFHAWQRLKNVCQALRQTEDKVRNLKSEIEAKLKSTEKLREKRAELQACRMSVQALEVQLEWRRTNARTAAARLTKARHRAAEFQIRMNNFCTDIDDLRTELAEKQRLYIGTREKLIWAAAQLFMRRRQMVQELRTIFFVEPVTPAATPSTGRNSTAGACNCKSPLKIVSVHLPDAENYYGHTELELAVGLSYAVQALIALSRIFDFSLRYEFEFFGSRSSVCDLINPQLPANQRIFPLHGRNQDKVAFQYGVFLLNKNIAQLRCDCGTFTQDLRCTLANLRSLFDHLADAKLEPYMYITRAMRLADGTSDDLGSAISTSFRRTSPSTSSGALSTDSGERSFRLEIPPSKLSIISSNQNASTSDFQDGLIPPVYGSDKKIERATNNNENANTIPTLPDDYAYKFTVESVNGNANATMDKELLRTCYLTADDEVVSQPDPEEHQESNGTVGLKFQKYFPPTTNCQTD